MPGTGYGVPVMPAGRPGCDAGDRSQMRLVTETLAKHGHYPNPELPDTIEWMIVDAEGLLGVAPTYEEVDALLLDTGAHDPEDCNVACVSALVEVLS